MKYSKKVEIFIANLQIKLNRIERPHCITSKANTNFMNFKNSKNSRIFTNFKMPTNFKNEILLR